MSYAHLPHRSLVAGAVALALSALTASPVSYCITAFVKQRKQREVNIGTELTFINKSSDLKASYGGLSYQTVRDVHFNLNYLYLSLFPELLFGHYITLNISAGPALGWLINSHVNGHSYTYNITGYYYSWNDNGNARKDFKALELRLFANIGVEIPVDNSFNIAINSTLSSGITNAGKGELGSYAGFINTRDITLTFGIAYKFNSNKLPSTPNATDKNNSNK